MAAQILGVSPAAAEPELVDRIEDELVAHLVRHGEGADCGHVRCRLLAPYG